MNRRILRTTIVLALLLGVAGGSAVAQGRRPFAPTDPARGNALTNPAFKGAEVIKFIGVKRGQAVADIFPGRFTPALAQAVGPKGKVYGMVPAQTVRSYPEVTASIAQWKLDPAYKVVDFRIEEIDAMVLPAKLDAVFIRQNYHDLHLAALGPADVPAFNRKVFAALKPGGVFVVQDHAALPGSGMTAMQRLHRIDPAIVKQEVMAAGFVLDAESPVLANPADDHTKMVLDPTMIDKTDQFVLRFKKPRR